MVLKFILRLQSLCSTHKLSMGNKQQHLQNPHLNTSASTLFAAVVISVSVLNWSPATRIQTKRAKKNLDFWILVDQILALKSDHVCWVLWVPTTINSLFRCTLPEAEGQSFKTLRYRWTFVARQLRDEKKELPVLQRAVITTLLRRLFKGHLTEGWRSGHFDKHSYVHFALIA